MVNEEELKVTSHEEEKEEDISRATLIWRAIKLPMYSVALIPLTVGTAAAYWQTGQFFARRYFMLWASSVLAILWINLSNDVYDFDIGADENKKESVVNLFGRFLRSNIARCNRTGTHVVAWFALVLGYVGLNLVSILEAKSLRSMPLFFSAVFCGYIYQCPPYRLSYQGLGEPLVFAAFGPFITISYYLLQRTTSELPITSTVVAASILVGFTNLILFCSHFHQIKDDMAVGKISPLVRLGTEASAKVVKMAMVALYSLLFIFGVGQILPLPRVILCGLTLPVGNLGGVLFDKTKIFMAKYYCVRLHTIFGAALAAGLVAARMYPRKPIFV
ncbi:2-carboxy-1,4-naphthoquinone phytyltransferase, chloroplastic [Olea europaea subsp. europaea]|uniref:2-carboxy-1,4-naphthoquinone phytyltransferase, chloroplastic n=1 Tax=Olea europaea subsp. europaea TaxID=158383 RepID=A0A8S0QZS3_OLEEU|nr:2-carboxy-1,4-naphthoquinone phytyltransferase, chloroplastic [Olea europaea subsp. europaea]